MNDLPTNLRDAIQFLRQPTVKITSMSQLADQLELFIAVQESKQAEIIAQWIDRIRISIENYPNDGGDIGIMKAVEAQIKRALLEAKVNE